MTQPKPPSIHIRNASLTFNNNLLFNKLNLDIAAGKLSCLLGPSGVGKTTLLRMIAGLVSTENCAFQGDIYCDNNLPINHQLSYLAQQDTLLPWMNALDNALIGYALRGEVTQTLARQADILFLKMGLEHAKYKFPRELSGGMRQRVALIRTLLEDKPIILMDEPFAALDAITRFQLQSLTANLLKNRTVFLITHDPLEALRMADDIYILSGIPANLHLFTQLRTNTPRDLSNPEILAHQALLFQSLTKAKEMSL